MSQENVEIVRGLYALFGDWDVDGVFRIVREDFELRLPDTYPEGPEMFRGPDGVRRWVVMARETWGDWRLSVERLIDADEKVVALVRIIAEGSASGARVDRAVAHVWSFRDGRPSSVNVHLDRAEALEALGLSE